MIRHPVALYVQATAHTNRGHFELFDRTERRPRRQLFGFVRRFARPVAAEPVRGDALTPDGSAA
jgi:hypothetical protein